MDHTLILRTRNRPYWIARALHSYARLNYTGLLLIDDDSEPECFDAISKLVTRYSSKLNIRHQVGAGNSMTRRVDRVRVSTIFTLKNISTKYYSISSDDDFQFPNFTKKAIKVLENDQTLGTINGPELRVFHNKDLEPTKWQVRPWSSYNQQDPLDRLYEYLYSPSLAYYGVSRTSSLEYYHSFYKQHQRDLFSRKGKGFGWYDEEIPFVFFTHIFGKIGYLKSEIMGIRGIYDSLDRVENFKHWKTFDEYTAGPIMSIVTPGAEQEFKRSIGDIRILIEIAGTKYDYDIVNHCAHQAMWRIVTGFKSGEIHPGADFWKTRFGNTKFQSIFNRLRRHAIRKQNRGLAWISGQFGQELPRYKNAVAEFHRECDNQVTKFD